MYSIVKAHGEISCPLLCSGLIRRLPTVSHAEINVVTGSDRDKMLFDYIVTQTKKVAIGPLEYCGNGTIVRTTHSKPL